MYVYFYWDIKDIGGKSQHLCVFVRFKEAAQFVSSLHPFHLLLFHIFDRLLSFT